MRYTIVGREYLSDHDVELARCNANPEAIMSALAAKTLRVKSQTTKRQRDIVSKYTFLRIVDHGETSAR